MYKRARLGMGYLPQEESIFRKLTVEQNIMAILETLPLNKKERKHRCEELLDQFGIEQSRKTSRSRSPAVKSAASPSPVRWSPSQAC